MTVTRCVIPFLYLVMLSLCFVQASQGKGSASSHYDLVVDAQSPSTLGGHSHTAISFTISVSSLLSFVISAPVSYFACIVVVGEVKHSRLVLLQI